MHADRRVIDLLQETRIAGASLDTIFALKSPTWPFRLMRSEIMSKLQLNRSLYVNGHTHTSKTANARKRGY